MLDRLDIPKVNLHLAALLLAGPLFVAAVLGAISGHSPLSEIDRALRALGIGASWPANAADWVGERSDVISVLASLVVVVAVVVLAAGGQHIIVGGEPAAATGLVGFSLGLQAGANWSLYIVYLVLGLLIGCGVALRQGVLPREAVSAVFTEITVAASAWIIWPVLLLYVRPRPRAADTSS